MEPYETTRNGAEALLAQLRHRCRYCEAGLAAARATVAWAHTQSLINAAALAFATGALSANTAAGLPEAGKINAASATDSTDGHSLD
jgi:hypothetical protein